MNDILIVDDTPENITVLREMLTAEGYKVRPALSGELGLKAVQAVRPDLILLDIMMPGMNGFEVCDKLKADKRTQDIPVIFISALTETEEKVKSFQSGGVDYISKPFHTAEVLARVRTHISLRKMYLQLVDEIRERKSAQESLLKINDELDQRITQRTEELDRKTERLTEANVALKVLLGKREEDKKDLEKNVLFNMEKLVYPYLEKLHLQCNDETQKTLLEILRSNLNEVTLPFAEKHKENLMCLTPTQIQIANLIKQGQTTKEIASLLNLSPSTIANHRQAIRKRLSLTNRKINLQAAFSSNS